MPKRLCLNAIVRNEAARIERMLKSVAPYISSWVIVDTGSTDGTQQIIEKFFADRKIPGLLGKCEFKSFAQARNVALAAARSSPIPYDYLLLCDADMELVVKDPTWLDDVQGDSFDMFQIAGAVQYKNRRLAKTGTTGVYITPTHEFINLDTGGCIPMEKAFFNDHADGSNRKDKFKRDIKLLKEELGKNPKDVRCMYYLAQSYRDAGKHEKAAKWYKRRVEAGGWDEEVWSAQQCYAACLGSMGDDAGYVRETLRAYQMRPSRAETLFDLSKIFREKGENALAALFSERAMEIPKTGDALFVNDYIYACGAADEFSISAFYLPEKRAKGFRVVNELSLKKSPYGFSRDLARSNLFHYYPMLKELCPSFTQTKVQFDTEDGWVPLNPSIIQHDGVVKALIRTVNYRIDEHGRYLIRGTDGTCNSTNPINTRTFFMHLDDTFQPKPDTIVELKEGVNVPAMPKPPAFPLVIGYEDMRLFNVGAALYASATVRELRSDGIPEQVSVPLFQHGSGYKRLTHEPFTCEKNWMPIIDDTYRWMYKLDEITDGSGSNVKNEVPYNIDAIGGGTQVIKIPGDRGGHLAVVHEARQIPGAPTRFYSHRFAAFGDDLQLQRLSLPFGFQTKGIEYAMGLCFDPRHPDHLLISYGFMDCEAHVGSVLLDDVKRLLCIS